MPIPFVNRSNFGMDFENSLLCKKKLLRSHQSAIICMSFFSFNWIVNNPGNIFVIISILMRILNFGVIINPFPPYIWNPDRSVNLLGPN